MALLSGVLGSAHALHPGGVLLSLVAGAAYAGYAFATGILLRRGMPALMATSMAAFRALGPQRIQKTIARAAGQEVP